MRKTIVNLMSTVLLGSFSTVIFAGSYEHCKEYADTAIKQVKTAEQWGCNFSKRGRWTSNYNGHFNWCIAVSETVSNRETRIRAAQVMRCIETKSQ